MPGAVFLFMISLPLGWLQWRRTAHPDATLVRFLAFIGGGLLLPALIWMSYHMGLAAVPSFIPEAVIAFHQGKYLNFLAHLGVSFQGLILTWMTVLGLWCLQLHWLNRHDRIGLLKTWMILLLLAVPIGWFLGVLLGLFLQLDHWGIALPCGLFVLGWLSPEEPEAPKTSYSSVEAKVKQGRYSQAEQELLDKLSHDPGDFKGWMMLAELLSRHFGEMQTARQLLDQLYQDGSMSPQEVAVAYNQLATWHLDLHMDPAGARFCLQRICELLPDTIAANKAVMRLQNLPTREQMEEARNPAKMALPQFVGMEKLAATVQDAQGFSVTEQLARVTQEPTFERRKSYQLRAEQLVEQLGANPNDRAGREELARIYADDYERLDLAEEQMNQLIETAHGEPGLAAHWLNTLATMQMRLGGGPVRACETLARVEQLFPESNVARAARRRIELTMKR